MEQVGGLLLAALCSPGSSREVAQWARDRGTCGQRTTLLPRVKVTREARSLGDTAGLPAGTGAAPGEAGQPQVDTHLEHVSLQPLHSPGLEAPSPGTCRQWESYPSFSPAMSYLHLSLGQSQVWKMLATHSWAISISPAGSQSKFLGSPLSLPPLGRGVYIQGFPVHIVNPRQIHTQCSGTSSPAPQHSKMYLFWQIWFAKLEKPG